MKLYPIEKNKFPKVSLFKIKEELNYLVYEFDSNSQAPFYRQQLASAISMLYFVLGKPCPMKYRKELE